MTKAVNIDDKVLWSFLLGLLPGAYALGNGVDLLGSIGVAVFGGCILLALTFFVLLPFAHWWAMRVVEGRSRREALVVVALGALLAIVFAPALLWVKLWLDAHLPKNDAMDVFGYVFVVLAFVYSVYAAYKARKERNKLKTIDLSKSRDLTLK